MIGPRACTRRWLLTTITLAAVATGARVAHAQETSLAAGVVREVGRARSLVEAGAGADARALLDSLVRMQTPGSNELAEALYWRAMLAERASDSERDWKRLTIEAPLSPRTADALVRLGEFEMLRGRPATARPYFARVTQDFPNTTARAKAGLWIVRGYFDERNSGAACSALAELPTSAVPEGELRLQYEELGKRCAVAGAGAGAGEKRNSGSLNSGSLNSGSLDDGNSGKAKSGKTNGGTANGDSGDGARFSVQLAAYDTRDEALATVKRLKGRGIEARIDGDAKPFRVRTGRYQTRAEATAALAKLKKQGQTGFVAELKP
ncbi:MAG: SPOR domain-containing protein [Gemmatimonadaceae bacterium]|nr:SPOR domain-containing protein [Gemmatimonadaceae bacterium]